MAAAATWPTAAGFAARSAAGTMVYSAAAPGRAKGLSPNPPPRPSQPRPPGPAPTTTPDRSWHGITGHASGQVSSPAVIAVARTCTSTSPGFGRGTGTLSYRRLAGSALEARMACILSGVMSMAIFLILPCPPKRANSAGWPGWEREVRVGGGGASGMTGPGPVLRARGEHRAGEPDPRPVPAIMPAGLGQGCRFPPGARTAAGRPGATAAGGASAHSGGAGAN